MGSSDFPEGKLLIARQFIAGSVEATAGIMAASFGGATISYYAIEKRFLKRKRSVPAQAAEKTAVEIGQN